MIIRILIILFVISSAAMADVAVVRGGEHPHFTRLVVESEPLGTWEFGRTDGGYELRMSPSPSDIDLARAFDRIPRDRVSGLWRDSASGSLKLALSCPCHAVAFEFRRGLVVIDIRDGDAPDSSTFERELATSKGVLGYDKAKPAPVAEPQPGSPTEGGITVTTPPPDISVKVEAESDNSVGTIPPHTSTDVGPLRDALIRQISQGVAQGVIELAEKIPEPPSVGEDLANTIGIRSGTDPLPGVAVAGADRPLTATGDKCLTDDALDLAGWLPQGAGESIIGDVRDGILVEFDAPDSEAILRSARLYLALGFGAEARQILSIHPAPISDDVHLLNTLSWIVDQEPPRSNVLDGMETCDSAAALWAFLARPDNVGIARTVCAAPHPLIRSFSALPLHLRRTFAPTLVEACLEVGEGEAARQLRDAVLRAPGDTGNALKLMDSQYHLMMREEDHAETLADEVLTDPRNLAAEAAVALTEAAFAGRQNVREDLPQQLIALQNEHEGTALGADLRRAIVLAAAMNGDFNLAFDKLNRASETVRDLWSLAVRHAPDDDFLQHAVGGKTGAGDVASDPLLRQAIARRLLGLGFGNDAKKWLGPISPNDEVEVRLLAAEVELRLRDARTALRHLAGLTSVEAERLRAIATLQLGDADSAATAYHLAGDDAARNLALAVAGDWQGLAASTPSPWQRASSHLLPASQPDGNPDSNKQLSAKSSGPMTAGTQLVVESAASRAAVQELLNALPSTW